MRPLSWSLLWPLDCSTTAGGGWEGGIAFYQGMKRGVRCWLMPAERLRRFNQNISVCQRLVHAKTLEIPKVMDSLAEPELQKPHLENMRNHSQACCHQTEQEHKLLLGEPLKRHSSASEMTFVHLCREKWALKLKAKCNMMMMMMSSKWNMGNYFPVFRQSNFQFQGTTLSCLIREDALQPLINPESPAHQTRSNGLKLVNLIQLKW